MNTYYMFGTPEQKARDMLERMGVENAQQFSSGEVIELANLIASCGDSAYGPSLAAKRVIKVTVILASILLGALIVSISMYNPAIVVLVLVVELIVGTLISVL